MKRLTCFSSPKRFIRIFAVAAVLSSVLFAGAIGYKHSTTHACGTFIIPNSTTTASSFNKPLATIVFSLWFNSCTGNNFTRANVTSGSVSNYTIYVVRESGPDGGIISSDSSTCPASGICNSPNVYSPHNLASAGITLRDLGVDIHSQAF